MRPQPLRKTSGRRLRLLSINKVYGIVKSYFKVTPIEVTTIDTIAVAA